MPSGSEANPPQPPAVKKLTAPAADRGHRKKRRNRTTQSCLNCHLSERMCNRKRPSCARCTQLGLSGLCVYEVDNPGQKQDLQDEHARLTTRVAELEAIIRELKKQPHPRWAWTEQQSDSEGEARSPLSGEIAMDTGPDSREAGVVDSPLGEDLSSCVPSSSYPSRPITPESWLPPPYHLYHAFLHSFFPFGGDPPISTPPDYFFPLSNMDLPLHAPSRRPSEVSNSWQGKESGPCGYLHETGNHTLVLDLSMRLRKAADVLTRSPCQCLLTRRILDLDKYIFNSPEKLTVLSDHASMLPADGSCLDIGIPSHGNSWGRMNYALHAQSANLTILNCPPPRALTIHSCLGNLRGENSRITGGLSGGRSGSIHIPHPASFVPCGLSASQYTV